MANLSVALEHLPRVGIEYVVARLGAIAAHARLGPLARLALVRPVARAERRIGLGLQLVAATRVEQVEEELVAAVLEHELALVHELVAYARPTHVVLERQHVALVQYGLLCVGRNERCEIGLASVAHDERDVARELVRPHHAAARCTRCDVTAAAAAVAVLEHHGQTEDAVLVDEHARRYVLDEALGADGNSAAVVAVAVATTAAVAAVTATTVAAYAFAAADVVAAAVRTPLGACASVDLVATHRHVVVVVVVVVVSVVVVVDCGSSRRGSSSLQIESWQRPLQIDCVWCGHRLLVGNSDAIQCGHVLLRMLLVLLVVEVVVLDDQRLELPKGI